MTLSVLCQCTAALIILSPDHAHSWELLLVQMCQMKPEHAPDEHLHLLLTGWVTFLWCIVKNMKTNRKTVHTPSLDYGFGYKRLLFKFFS